MSDLSSALNRAAGARRAPEPAAPHKGLLLRLEPAMHKRLRLLAVQEHHRAEARRGSAGDAASVSGRLGGGHRTTGLRSSKPYIIPAYPD